jgi:hypothetical protein
MVAMVLWHLDSMRSLAAAIFSHSSVYAAFAEHRSRIVSGIMANQIPPETLKHALCVHFSAAFTRSGSRDMDRIAEFLSDHFNIAYDLRPPPDPFALPGPLDPHLAAALSRTHNVVQYFTRDPS